MKFTKFLHDDYIEILHNFSENIIIILNIINPNHLHTVIKHSINIYDLQGIINSKNKIILNGFANIKTNLTILNSKIIGFTTMTSINCNSIIYINFEKKLLLKDNIFIVIGNVNEIILSLTTYEKDDYYLNLDDNKFLDLEEKIEHPIKKYINYL